MYIRIYYIEKISIDSRARLPCIGQVPVLWLFIVKVNYTTCGNNAEKLLDQTEKKFFWDCLPFSQGLDNHPL